MKIFFASACSSKIHHECWRETGVRNYLFSYANSEALFKANRSLYNDPANTIVVDSGAFTAWTKGKEISFLDYVSFCKEVRNLSKCRLFFINLDSIPGAFRRRPTKKERDESATVGWENYCAMRDEGIPVIHVFHQHESFDWLDRLAASSDYIGISPANDVSASERSRWLRLVFSRLGDVRSTGLRTHAFGVTTLALMEEFPFYSVDSTSWLAPSLYGGLAVFSPKALSIVNTVKGQWREKVSQGEDLARLLAPHVVGSSKGYKYVTVKAIEAYLETERFLTGLWAQRGLAWREG
jgi:hypothetical protein